MQLFAYPWNLLHTPWGSRTPGWETPELEGLIPAYPWDVKARKSFLLTEGSFKVENKEHLFDFVLTLFIISYLRMKRSLVKFVSFCKGCDQNGDRVSKNNESCHFALDDQKVILVSY